MSKLCCTVLLLYAVPFLLGQGAMARLVAESVPLRGRYNVDWTKQKDALRDWIESRLPANITELDAGFSNLETQLNAEVGRAGLTEPSDFRFGYVSKLTLMRPIEYPAALVVRAGVSAGCGNDESVYLYRFSQTRTLLLRAEGAGKWGSSVFETLFSGPDEVGSRVFYVSWYDVQCGSNWNRLDYRLFRVSSGEESAVPLFSSTHTFVPDDGAQVKLTSEELLLEVVAEALEGGFRRTHEMRYKIKSEGVERIDPVALQPQDFVHEWMIRPWEEMKSRSSEDVVKWHKFLHADLVFGGYDTVQPCLYRPGFTQVAVELQSLADREIPEPLAVYFLIQDKGNYSYEMSEISFYSQDDCPGETPPADYSELPSLFKKK